MIQRRLAFAPLFPALMALATLPVLAASPPALVNYQGVLRDAADKPRNGTFDMTFHFFDALTGGSEILVDAHTGGGGVVVTGGLFNVALGSGTVTDGSGSGTYTSLEQVFRDYSAVWMEVQVGAETLSPRIQVQAEPYALNSSNLGGQPAAYYLEISASNQIKDGSLSTNQGLLGYNDTGAGFGYGVWGRGATGGGFFRSSTGSAIARAGYGDTGILASGTATGGLFQNASNTSLAYVGYPSVGVSASGDSYGGGFLDSSGTSSAYLGTTAYGVDATASGSPVTAGRFRNTWNAYGGSAFLGYGSYGIYATTGYGQTAAAFDNGGLGAAYLATGNFGISGLGNFCGVGCGGGGLFMDFAPLTHTISYVAYNDVGIETHASGSGGSFYNTNGIATALAAGSFGVSSNGTKSFVQNHPEDPQEVIAYTALEGDEAGTYTRGSARLAGGEARIPLAETYKWVTNPDLGLTVHLTPVGEWADLYVASKSTSEIVVRSRDPRAANAAFDYIVFGLRIGFESNPVVREKEHEMPIPPAAAGESLFAGRPDLRRFTALSRFLESRKAITGKDEPLDLSASEALKAKIHVFDPARDGAAFRAPAAPPTPATVALPSGSFGLAGLGHGSAPGRAGTGAAAPSPPAAPALPAALGPGPGTGTPGALLFPPNTSPIGVEGTVRAGDVVTVTDAPAGAATLAGKPFDRGVIGIVGGERDASWTGSAPLVLSGAVASCSVDATAGAIQAGDLLVSSSTPGHAMRAGESPAPGTVVAKALEPLEGGTGVIRVLVLSR